MSTAVSETFDGWTAARSVEPARLSMRRLCNLVWFYLVEHAPDEKSRDAVRAQLLRPLPGQEHKVSQAIVDHERDMFKGLVAKGFG